MTHSRADDALATMRAANPFPVEELRAAIDEAELTRAMRRAIAAGDLPVRPIPAGDRIAMERGAGGGPGLAGIFSRHRAASIGLGLACVAAIAVLIVLGGGSIGSVKNGGRPTYAAAAVKVAESNPRLLVTAPGWSIIHANSFEAEYGGLTYRDAGHPAFGPEGLRLTMSWAPASLYRSTLREYRPKATVTRSTLLGRQATTFHYRGRPAYVTVLPPQGNVFVTLALPADEHETLLRSLRAVSVERWLAAMPPEVVQPAAESGVIAQMLRGVPLPPGLDPSSLAAEGELTSRFELGRAVAGAVACGWLESWDAATRSGDAATAEAAVEAMSGARHWAVLLQMVHERGFRGDVLPPHGSGWPASIVKAAREIAAGHLRHRPAVKTRYAHGVVIGVQTPRNAAPVSVLGCRVGG
ncbi:MAG TPA: hypothetical protein VFI09_10445 [Solirubrobacterales bacterium]|nr:hypothetical protein [Solirubrobacterales bacterium]